MRIIRNKEIVFSPSNGLIQRESCQKWRCLATIGLSFNLPIKFELESPLFIMALQHSTPYPANHAALAPLLPSAAIQFTNVVNLKDAVEAPVTPPKHQTLASKLQYVILQEEAKLANLAQEQASNESTLATEIGANGIAYKHRHIAKGKGYALTASRTPNLTTHLQTALFQLDVKSQRIERQWLNTLSQGLLLGKPAGLVAEGLLMLKLQQPNVTFTKLSSQLFQFCQWLKQQNASYANTVEGKQLASIIRCIEACC